MLRVQEKQERSEQQPFVLDKAVLNGAYMKSPSLEGRNLHEPEGHLSYEIKLSNIYN
ncbi:hypothetical protein QWZ16_09210 [Vibrio ostreicida]|uniref:Uncharacterized protein n=1 Tax=Vibrio ostreicida TaxID=526588 RepID=A0ABT8BUQ7_9VIBR|nr:hypothetical protein [Vibrio ostreicida]MDN3609875.1 hypothetical protein [Vibrio ostreicida]